MGKRLNKKVIIIVVIVLIVALIGGGLFFLLSGMAGPFTLKVSVGDPVASATVDPFAVAQVATPEVQPTEEVPPVSGVMVDLGSKVVNLADPGGYRYLRVGIVLEFAPSSELTVLKKDPKKAEEVKKEEQALKDEVTASRPVIDDVIVGLLSSKAFGDIFTLEGKETLKEELRMALNEKLEELEVARIYFTDFLVQ